MEENLDDARAIAVEMALMIHDRLITLLPNGHLVLQLVRKPLTGKKLGMHAHDEHLFVVGTIEDADASTLWQATSSSPKEIVFELLGARLLEAENLTPLRIDT